jgi:wnt family
MNKLLSIFQLLSIVVIVQSRTTNRIVKRNELSYDLSNTANKDFTSDIIASSTELALENCQKSFRWEKWNCPSNSFLSKRNSNIVDREQAFVKALLTASLIYNVMKNCSRENQENCGCKTLKEILGNDMTFSLTGCKTSTAKQDSNLSKDAIFFANFHNTQAGETVRILI